MRSTGRHAAEAARYVATLAAYRAMLIRAGRMIEARAIKAGIHAIQGQARRLDKAEGDSRVEGVAALLRPPERSDVSTGRNDRRIST